MIKNGHGNKMKDKLTVIHLFLKRERECDFAIASDRFNYYQSQTVPDRFRTFRAFLVFKRPQTVENG
jgi:hypothetical protein